MIRYQIIDSHRNMSQKRRNDLVDFFMEVKSAPEEAAEKQVDFCDWYESEYAVKWFEVLAINISDHKNDGQKETKKLKEKKSAGIITKNRIVGYLRCFRNPDDVKQWYIGDVHVRAGYRKQGIATRMYQKVFSELERYEAAENVISAVRKDNKNSIGLHEKMGFVDTKEPCVFAAFFVDKDETKYQKWLYRYLPVPEDIEVDKLHEILLPVYKNSINTKDKRNNQDDLRDILIRMKNGEFDIETIWCGNRLVGFKYLESVVSIIIGEGRK